MALPEPDWTPYYRWCCTRYCAWALERSDPEERRWHAGSLAQHLEWLRGALPGVPHHPASLREASAAFQANLPWLTDPGPGLMILIHGSACPVSASGVVDGYLFWFRSRSVGWDFGVSPDWRDPMDMDQDAEGFYTEEEPAFAEDFVPSWLSARQTHQLLTHYADIFRRDAGWPPRKPPASVRNP